MNKILPIILVVVLSGCGGFTKTSLENCADAQTDFSDDLFNDVLSLKNRPWYNTEEIEIFIDEPTRFLREELSIFYKQGLFAKDQAKRRLNIAKVNRLSHFDKSRARSKDRLFPKMEDVEDYEKDIDIFINDMKRIKKEYDDKTLKEKFEYKKYISSYMKCEKMKEKHPETFKINYD